MIRRSGSDLRVPPARVAPADEMKMCGDTVPKPRAGSTTARAAFDAEFRNELQAATVAAALAECDVVAIVVTSPSAPRSTHSYSAGSPAARVNDAIRITDPEFGVGWSSHVGPSIRATLRIFTQPRSSSVNVGDVDRYGSIVRVHSIISSHPPHPDRTSVSQWNRKSSARSLAAWRSTLSFITRCFETGMANRDPPGRPPSGLGVRSACA